MADTENRVERGHVACKQGGSLRGEEPTKDSFPELITKAKCKQPVDWRLEVLPRVLCYI